MSSTANSSRAAPLPNEVETGANRHERQRGTSSRTQHRSRSMHNRSSHRERTLPAENPRVGRFRELASGGPMRSVNHNIVRRDNTGSLNAFAGRPSRNSSSLFSRRFDRNSAVQNGEHRERGPFGNRRNNGIPNTPNVAPMPAAIPAIPLLQEHPLPVLSPEYSELEHFSNVEASPDDFFSGEDSPEGFFNEEIPSEDIFNFFNEEAVAPENPPRVEQDYNNANAGRNAVVNQEPMNAANDSWDLPPTPRVADRRLDQYFDFVIVNTKCKSIHDWNEATDFASRRDIPIKLMSLADMPIGSKKMLAIRIDRADRNPFLRFIKREEKWANAWSLKNLLREQSFFWPLVSQEDLIPWILVVNWHKYHEPTIDTQVLKTKKDCHFVLTDCFMCRHIFPPFLKQLNNKGKIMVESLAARVGVKIGVYGGC